MVVWKCVIIVGVTHNSMCEIMHLFAVNGSCIYFLHYIIHHAYFLIAHVFAMLCLHAVYCYAICILYLLKKIQELAHDFRSRNETEKCWWGSCWERSVDWAFVAKFDPDTHFRPVWYMVLAGWNTGWLSKGQFAAQMIQYCLNCVKYWWYISYHTLFGISDRISALGPIYHPSLRSGWYTGPAGWYTVWYTK